MPSRARLLPVRPSLAALALAGALAAARPLAAQQPVPAAGASDTVAVDAALARARQAVGSGSTSMARALLDSLVTATEPASPRYADLLFWRATYAATAAEAERDYRRIAVEYPLSPRAEDALMRLAQLELARGDQALAIRHLERLVLEHPESPSRPRASYWMGRAWLERGETARGCEALGRALATAPAGEVELRNQVAYAGASCPRGWDRVATPAPAPAAAPATAPALVAAAPAVAATPAVAGDTMMRPATVDSAAPATVPPAPATAAARPAPAAPAFSVQVAAYDTRGDAEALVRRLRARGLDARLASSAKPFRVRVGRWSRAEAVRQKAALAAKGIAGFLVEAETQP